MASRRVEYVGKEGRKGGNQWGCYVANEVVGWLVGLHWRVGDTWRRWSHMCGSWYLPRFLLRVGSCTQMNMTSLMVLEWLLTSLCTMLNWFESMGCPVVVLWWCMGGGFEVFFYPFT